MLRTSERNLFKRCQWQWEREYVDRLKTKRESQALWFGTGIHEALEHWYIPGRERGTDPRETFRKYMENLQGDTDWINTYRGGEFEEAVPALELGLDMLSQYLEEYGNEPHLEVISPEQTFQVKVPHMEWSSGDGLDDTEMHRRETATTYVGTFDLVLRDHRKDGKIFMWDHKTAAQLGSAATQYLPLDDQAGAYFAIADYTLRKQGLIDKSEALSGIVYNYLRKAKKDTRPRNEKGQATNKPTKSHFEAALLQAGIEIPKKATAKVMEELAKESGITVLGDVSATQPPVNFERKVVRRSRKERVTQIKRIQNDLEHMSLVRNNLLPATKTPVRECSFCPVRDLCELDERGKDWQGLAETEFQKWDPYESHRKALSES